MGKGKIESAGKGKKEVTAVIKMQIPAGKANPAPPVGSMLGPKGINIKGFCDEFNEKTRSMGDVPVPVEIFVYADRSFSFIMKTAPASFLIKKLAKLVKGSKIAGREVVATIKRKDLEEIAKIKMAGMGVNSMDAALNSLSGTARSMGIKVEE